MELSLFHSTSGKNRKAVGLDIGTAAVKMVAVEGVPGRLNLLDCAVSLLERAPEKSASLDYLTRAIEGVIGRNGLDLSDLRIAVSGNGVIVRQVDMPRMSHEELRLSIKYEAEPLLPFRLEEAIFDFFVLNPEEKHQAKMKVLLAAARKSVVQQRLEILKTIGIVPKVIGIDAIALANAFEAAVPELDAEETVSVVNVGAARSTLNIVSGKTLELTRGIEVGSDRATVAIARGLGIEVGDAENKKMKGDPSVKELVSPMTVLLVRELRSTFDYVSSKMHRKVEGIYLSGGGSLSPGLVEVLATELGTEVMPWNPLLGLTVTDESVLNNVRGKEVLLAVATGLAIS